MTVQECGAGVGPKEYRGRGIVQDFTIYTLFITREQSATEKTKTWQKLSSASLQEKCLMVSDFNVVTET